MAETKAVNYKRSTATKALLDLINRVKELNTDKESLLSVSKLYIFGSYVKKVDSVHDLDVFIELTTTDKYKHMVTEIYANDSTRLALDYADKSGRSFKNFWEAVLWWREEPLRKLKNGSHIISLHDFSELETLQLQTEQYVPIISDGVVNVANLQGLLAS